MSINLQRYVAATVLRENSGDISTAYRDLSARYVNLCLLLDRAERLYSRAYAREGAPTEGALDVPPNPITDDWIETGKELESA
jgi:hypothetical protein